jgi:TIR domain
MPSKGETRPVVFISYCRESNDHRRWVQAFADRLLLNGVKVIVDSLSLTLGESVTQFMESAIQSSDVVLLVCTPEYKRRSDARQHGVGYEAELLAARRVRREQSFVPVLRKGDWFTSLPEWAAGLLGVDLRADSDEAEFNNLLRFLKGRALLSRGTSAERRKPLVYRYLNALRRRLRL